MRVRPSLEHSFERLLLIFAEAPRAAAALAEERLERAIGVIYRPESERLSHG